MENKLRSVNIYYLKLQFKRFERFCSELGMPSLLALFISLLIFAAASFLLFERMESATIIYFACSIFALMFVVNRSPLDLLKSIFTKRQLIIIRLLEHLLIAVPFMIILIIKSGWMWMVALLMTAITLAFTPIHSFNTPRIPTPFKKLPFEAIVGFRRWLVLILISYFLLAKAIQVDNSNLGIAMPVFLILLCVTFYLRIEPMIYVWIYRFSPRKFLWLKLKSAYKCTMILIFPMIILIGIFFPESMLGLLIALIYGLMILTLLILAKWASYPEEINIPQAVLMGIAFLLPPVLVFIMFMFYKKAVGKLTPILVC